MAKLSKKQKILTILLASFAGLSGTAVSSVVIAYDAFFQRYDRPDYALYPGQYCIERMPELSGREETWIQSGDHKIKAYYYEAKNSLGLVVFAHGFHAGADEYLPIFKYLTEHGFSVFTYNVTGTYESEGEGTEGMCQSLVEIDNVIGYLQKHPRFMDMPLLTMGHSWGGYAASAVLALKKGIKACAVIAPMNNGATVMLEKGEQYVGKISNAGKPVFYAYQKALFGSYVNESGVKGINSVDIPVLVAQGIDDETITYDGQSITAKKSEITNKNVTYYIGRGVHGDHNNIWHSKEACLYQLEVASDLKLLEIQKGDKLTDSEKAEYFKNVNHELYSAVNLPLMERVVDTFKKGLNVK